jgi:hypothetical protein
MEKPRRLKGKQMCKLNLPDPAKYNAMQSEALFRDAFAIIKQFLNDSNTEVHLENASEFTKEKFDEVLEAVAKKAPSSTK